MMRRTQRVFPPLAPIAIALMLSSPASAFCIVTNGGCKSTDGTQLIERDGHYVNPTTGERVMDVPAAPDRPMQDHYVSGPLNAAEGIATPIGRADSARDEEDDDGSSLQRRLNNAWSASAKAQVLRDEQRRVEQANRDPAFERRLSNAWSADTRERVLREAGRLPPKKQPPVVAVPSGPPAVSLPPIFNAQTGEALIPSAGGNYVGSRDGRVYTPVGPNMLFDTRTGQYLQTH